MDERGLRELVHRVAVRACAERGNTAFVREHASVAPGASGVHVVLGPCDQLGERPEEAPPELGRARHGGRELIDLDALDRLARGTSLRVPPGAIVTPLAEEEARRRGIALLRGTAGILATKRPSSGSDSSAAGLAIAVGCDHGGFRLKTAVLEWLAELGHVGVDFGTRDESAVDYPDFARAVAEAVADGRVDFGIVVDGAGLGSTMAANKVPGVRAANCWSEQTASNAREHNYANVLALGSGVIDEVTARDVVRKFLSTPEGPVRHARRVNKITAIEERYTGPRRSGGPGVGAPGEDPCECGDKP